jgi:hypothetical protein
VLILLDKVSLFAETSFSVARMAIGRAGSGLEFDIPAGFPEGRKTRWIL